MMKEVECRILGIITIFYACSLQLKESVWSKLNHDTVHNIVLHNIVLHNIVLHNIVLHNIALHNIVLHNIALHNIALHNIVLHNIALHNIALHNIALHNIALHNIVLHNIVLHIGETSQYQLLKWCKTIFCVVISVASLEYLLVHSWVSLPV